MNSALHTAAQDIATHVAAMEARRGEPFANAFSNQLAGGLPTPKTVGIPVTLLHALCRSVAAGESREEEVRRQFNEQSGFIRAGLLQTIAGVTFFVIVLGWLGPRIEHGASYSSYGYTPELAGEVAQAETAAHARCIRHEADNTGYIATADGGIVCTDKRGRRHPPTKAVSHGGL